MQMNGSFVVKKDKSSSISKLSAAKDILNYIPDVVDSEIVDEKNLVATVKAGVGFIKGRFKTKIALDQSNPCEITITGNGSGSNSSMNFTVIVNFSGDEDETTIKYDADVGIAGTAATMGQRIIERAATKYVNTIMEKFKSSFD